MVFDNHIIISNYDNIDIDFKNYLSKKDSLIFKNCSKIKLNISSKINKIIFIKCKYINIKCSETIAGIDFENCDSAMLVPTFPYSLKYIDCYKTSLKLYINTTFDLNFKINNQLSNIKIINTD
jgi:hypothetical protein